MNGLQETPGAHFCPNYRDTCKSAANASPPYAVHKRRRHRYLREAGTDTRTKWLLLSAVSILIMAEKWFAYVIFRLDLTTKAMAARLAGDYAADIAAFDQVGSKLWRWRISFSQVSCISFRKDSINAKTCKRGAT